MKCVQAPFFHPRIKLRAHRRPGNAIASFPGSSVRNARALNLMRGWKNGGWTNFTRDPRHRRHKCLTRNSVTYSVLVCTCSWKLLASASVRCPIALASSVSKVLERVILSKYEMYFCSNPLQFGFKPGYSTTQASLITIHS